MSNEIVVKKVSIDKQVTLNLSPLRYLRMRRKIANEGASVNIDRVSFEPPRLGSNDFGEFRVVISDKYV